MGLMNWYKGRQLRSLVFRVITDVRAIEFFFEGTMKLKLQWYRKGDDPGFLLQKVENQIQLMETLSH